MLFRSSPASLSCLPTFGTHRRLPWRPETHKHVQSVRQFPGSLHSLVTTLTSSDFVEATASYAVAAVHGLADEALTLGVNLAACRRIADAIKRVDPSTPFSIDLQEGYGDQLAEAVQVGSFSLRREEAGADREPRAGDHRPRSCRHQSRRRDVGL